MSSLTPSGIRSISCIISARTCSSLVVDRDIGVGGGYLGYRGRSGVSLGCGGKFGVDFVLWRPRVRRESVDLVFRRSPSIGDVLTKISDGHKLCRSLYLLTMSPSDEKAVSDSHVASEMGYPFHFM